VHILSQRSVPASDASTSPMIWKRNASSGKGARCTKAFASGITFQAASETPATDKKRERNKAWFSDRPFIQGRPL